jgi:hypothetical protein
MSHVHEFEQLFGTGFFIFDGVGGVKLHGHDDVFQGGKVRYKVTSVVLPHETDGYGFVIDEFFFF